MISKEDKFLKISEVSKRLDFPYSTFYRMLKRGDGTPKVYQVGGSLRIKESELNQWLENMPEKELSTNA